MNNVTRIALLGASLSIMPSPAFAYIDPAVGSMVFQGIVGDKQLGDTQASVTVPILDRLEPARPEACSRTDSDGRAVTATSTVWAPPPRVTPLSGLTSS